MERSSRSTSSGRRASRCTRGAWRCSSTPMCATSGGPTSSSLWRGMAARSWSVRVTSSSMPCPWHLPKNQNHSIWSTPCWKSAMAWPSIAWRCTSGHPSLYPRPSACPFTTSTSPRRPSSLASARCGRSWSWPSRHSLRMTCQTRTAVHCAYDMRSWSASWERSTELEPSLCMQARWPTRGWTTSFGWIGNSLRWRTAMRTPLGKCCASRGRWLPVTATLRCSQW
mmetsp:Transcript_12799/g.34904  ORF Transcript_12799/g.34904 Transcript_12799/m.34904 type:complete len:225 (+) Transcript_12799:1787-2461(+)